MELDSHISEEGEEFSLLDDGEDKEDQLCLPTEWVDLFKEEKLLGAVESFCVDSVDSLRMKSVDPGRDKYEDGKGQEESIEELSSTQPDREDLDRQRNGEGGKRKKEIVWGPVLVERRSKRNLRDGKSVLEKAQELKKKVNLQSIKAALWGAWKLRNGVCFHSMAWRSMEHLLLLIWKLSENWSLLCPDVKKQEMEICLDALKRRAEANIILL